jgi:putative tryptophan/tyrosine transport system substrate-binding protein
MEHNLQGKSRKIWVLLTWLIAVTLLVSGCGGGQSSKVYRVGILSGFDFPGDSVADGFIAAMAELGYVEGENIIYDLQETHVVDMQGYQDIAQKFVDDEVDLILSFPSEASLIAKQVAEGSGVPVIFSFAAGEGLYESVQAPGGNITGVRYPLIEIAKGHFEITMQLVPDAKKVLIPYFTDYPILPPQFEAIAPLAEAAGVTIVKAPVTSGDEMQAFFDDLLAEGEPDIDAIFYLVGPASTSPDIASVVAQFGAEYQIPIATGTILGPDDTWTITDVNVGFYNSGELAAPLADKIFRGVPAGTIPVVSPEPYLHINFAAAQEFGLTVPEGLLKQADEIIR